MLIGLISDTHDHVPHIQKAAQIFQEQQVDVILHAGDYCSPFTIPHFKGLKLKGIFGNNDGDRYLLMKKFDEIGAELLGDFASLQLDGLKLALYHGTYAEITDALIMCGVYDVVISGHTHVKVNKTTKNTVHVNPGTAHGFDGEATVAILDTETQKTEFIKLN